MTRSESNSVNKANVTSNSVHRKMFYPIKQEKISPAKGRLLPVNLGGSQQKSCNQHNSSGNPLIQLPGVKTDYIK